MASTTDLSNDETFFQGIINETQLNGKTVDNILPLKITPLRKVTRNSRKSQILEQSVNENEAVSNKATIENPNQVTKKSEVRKSPSSAKKTRQPLKTLHINKEIPREEGNQGMKANPSKKEISTSSPGEAVKKENKSFSKIIIYEDATSFEKNPKLKNQSAEVREEGQKKGRYSFPEAEKSNLKNIVRPKNQKIRHSIGESWGRKVENDKKHKSESPSPFKNGFFDKKLAAKSKLLSKPTPSPEEIEEAVKKLENMFPDIDPDYIRAQYIKLKWTLSDTIEVILIKAKSGELPTRAEYLRRVELEKLENKYRNEFSVANYLKLIPDPWKLFLEPETRHSARYADHSFYYLKNKFKKHYIQVIQDFLTRNEFSLYLTCKDLQRKNRALKLRATNRSKYECEAAKPSTFEIMFMHEVALIENEDQIKAHLKKIDAARHKRLVKAEKDKNLLECLSCCDYGLLKEDTLSCSDNHVFCLECIINFVTVEVKNENYEFKCLQKCEKIFCKKTIQETLGPMIISSIIQRLQKEYTKAPGIDTLVSCPFCHSIRILSEDDTVFRCSEPGCSLAFCRYCKQLNHAPAKCIEQEKFEKDKTEDKVIHSVLKCFHCNEKFLEGKTPDRLVCPCGATICSVCRQPYPDCPHFRNSIEENNECENNDQPNVNYNENNEDLATNFIDSNDNLNGISSNFDDNNSEPNRDSLQHTEDMSNDSNYTNDCEDYNEDHNDHTAVEVQQPSCSSDEAEYDEAVEGFELPNPQSPQYENLPGFVYSDSVSF